MAVEVNSSLNKSLHKILLYLIKVVPMVMTFVSLINSIFSYYDIEMPLLSYIGGSSLLTLIFLYLSSYIFKFCEYHRMFIHYITLIWVLNIIDLYIGIPIGDFYYLLLQLIIAGISLFIILYLYVKNHRKIVKKYS